MHKLVIVGGKLRGKEFSLLDGENTFGRDAEADFEIDVKGVSKKHFKITIQKDDVLVEDLGSSNGTLVNGKLIKRKHLSPGDKLALPNVIFQLVKLKEKKVYIKKEVEEENEGFGFEGSIPQSPVGKLIYFFKNKFMPYIHKINEEYEWRVLIGIFMVIFLAINVAITIVPIIRDNKRLLLRETAKRGAHYADEIARLNATSLEQRALDRVDTNFLNFEDGVASYELFDPDGRIVRPINKLNEYTSDIFSIRAREWAVKDNRKGGQVLQTLLEDGKIGIAQRIVAYNPKLGYEELVGIIAIHFQPSSLLETASNNQRAYLEAFLISILFGIIFFGIIYFLTLRPINEMNYQIEEALGGRRKELSSPLLMSELAELKNTINSLLQRIRDLDNQDELNDFDEIEDDTIYVEKLSNIFETMPGPAIVLDSEKKIKRMNSYSEDLLGIRETASVDEELIEVAREKGVAATITELCDESASGEGKSYNSNYELQGQDYQISVASLLGKDNFAKAFIVTFTKDDF